MGGENLHFLHNVVRMLFVLVFFTPSIYWIHVGLFQGTYAGQFVMQVSFVA